MKKRGKMDIEGCLFTRKKGEERYAFKKGQRWESDFIVARDGRGGG